MIDNLFRLDGHVAVVTGGLGRRGSQYARALTAAGASVALFDLPGRSSEIVSGLVEAKQPVAVYELDAARRAEVDRAVAAVTQRFGAPTILVNNAGLGSSPADAAPTGLREVAATTGASG